MDYASRTQSSLPHGSISLPSFPHPQVVSAYEYLERRFGRPIRLTASAIFILQMVFYMSVVVYAPAVTLQAVTSLSKWAAIFSVGIVCTFYCTIGKTRRLPHLCSSRSKALNASSIQESIGLAKILTSLLSSIPSRRYESRPLDRCIPVDPNVRVDVGHPDSRDGSDGRLGKCPGSCARRRSPQFLEVSTGVAFLWEKNVVFTI